MTAFLLRFAIGVAMTLLVSVAFGAVAALIYRLAARRRRRNDALECVLGQHQFTSITCPGGRR